jgi:hypothetical protein
MAEDEGHIGPGQRRPPQGLLRVPKLGLGGSQKLAACRYVEKQIPDLDGGAPRAGRSLGTEDPAPLDRHPNPTLRRVLGGEDLEPRHRRDRWQRLAAEAKGDDVQKVFIGADL